MMKVQLSPLPVEFMHSAMEPQHINQRLQTQCATADQEEN